MGSGSNFSLSLWFFVTGSPKVSKMPAFLRSALQILFSEDSAKLFVASNQGSLHVIRLLEGSFKHLHTFQPQSGEKLVIGHGRELSVSMFLFFHLNLSCWGFTNALLCPTKITLSFTCLRFKVEGDTWRVKTLNEIWSVAHTYSFLTGFLIPYLGPEKFHHSSWSSVSRARRKLNHL